MREIKFRVWDKEYKRMEYLGAIYFSHPKGQNPGVIEYIALDKYDTRYDADAFVLMQFTSLKDKNGKEIYEGDIVKFIILADQAARYPKEALLQVIEEKNACWGFRPVFPGLQHEDDREWRSFWMPEDGEMWHRKYFEVIGNIYENPDLLVQP